MAEFNDTITLRADGRVNGSTRSVHNRTCTLDRERRRDLVAALGTLTFGGPGATGVRDPSAAGSDGGGGTGSASGNTSGSAGATSQIVFSVVDARGRSVDLSEPSLASALTMARRSSPT